MNLSQRNPLYIYAFLVIYRFQSVTAVQTNLRRSSLASCTSITARGTVTHHAASFCRLISRPTHILQSTSSLKRLG